MRTIGRHIPKGTRDVEALCDICGVHWPRSRLRRSTDGRLHCPDEGMGMDAVECSESDAEAVADRPDRRGDMEPGNTNSHIDLDPAVPITVFI